MEDSDEEYWKMEDFKDYSKSKSYDDGKLWWIWRKGICLSKKIVVTGAVISSAPFVLPPLVALSAIGFAFSVPAGFVFATYACTDKLMDKLLSTPSSPFFEGMGMVSSSDEEEYRMGGDDFEKGYEEEDDLETEEKEFEEVTRKGIEMRIELVEDDDRGNTYGYGHQVANDEDNTRLEVPHIVEEGEYEEAIGEYMDVEEQPLESDAIPSIIEGIQEAENEISLMEREGVEMPKDSVSAFVVAAEVGGKKEDNVEQIVEELAFVPPEVTVEENELKGNLADIDEGELRRETTGIIEQVRDEGKDDTGKRDTLAEVTPEENETNREIPIKDMSEDRGNMDLFVIPEEVKPTSLVGAKEVDNEDRKKSEKRDDEIMQDRKMLPVLEKTLQVKVRASGGHTATDVRQGTGSGEKLGTLIFPEADASGMVDESGSDLHDNVSESADKVSDSLNRSEGDEVSSSSVADVNVEYHEVRVESAIFMPKPAVIALDQQTTGISEKAPLVSEDKIWEQLHALRTIVGHKTAPESSCMEELKALYVLTGVEPPATSMGIADLADINEKLHFLMSIVGVK